MGPEFFTTVDSTDISHRFSTGHGPSPSWHQWESRPLYCHQTGEDGHQRQGELHLQAAEPCLWKVSCPSRVTCLPLELVS